MWSHLTLGPLLQGQMRIAKFKCAYNSFIIGPRDLQCDTNLQAIVSYESSDGSGPFLGPSKVKRGRPNLKVLIIHLLLALEVCNEKPTYSIP